MQALKLILRRILDGASTRQSLTLAGAFLFVTILFPQTVNAQPMSLLAPNKAVIVSPLEEQNKHISDIASNLKSKQTLIEERADQIEEIKKEVQVIAQTKETLAEQVQSIKSEVEELKARLEEKKRLDAVRIVDVQAYDSDAAGNSYALGNCTWYVKSRRADIGNMWGDAHSWYSSAKYDGFKTGEMAKTGAIGVSFSGRLGHVVYVEKWLGDGEILVSEMNYSGLYSQRSRVALETDFVYIYEKPY